MFSSKTKCGESSKIRRFISQEMIIEWPDFTVSPIYLLKGPSEQIYHCKPPPDHFKALNNFPENPGVIFESKCDILKE